MRFSKRRLLTACAFSLLFLPLLPFFMPQVRAFSSELETNSTVFMQKFQTLYDYVHYALNTTDFSLHHWNLNPSAVDYAWERWTLTHFTLYLTFAYEITSDTQYLFEAKYFVENLDSHLDSSDALEIYPKTGWGGWLYADASLLWAKQKLNEYGFGSYNITGKISDIIGFASVDNSIDLGWYYTYTSENGDQTLNTWTWFMMFLSYATWKNIGDYTDEVERIYHYMETARQSDDLYAYNIGDTQSNPPYSATVILAMMVARHFIPDGNFNNTKTQLSINALANSALTGGSPEIGAMSYWDSGIWTMPEQHLISLKNTAENYRYDVKNPWNGWSFSDNGRDVSLSPLLIFGLSQMATPSLSWGGYYEKGDYGYILNFTSNWNRTRIEGMYTWFDSVRLSAPWYSLGAITKFSSLLYNSTGEYYEGQYTYSGNTLTEKWYKDMRKVVLERTDTNNGSYKDRFGTGDKSSQLLYLHFVNGSFYNMSSLSLSTTITVTDSQYFAFQIYQRGSFHYYVIYKTNNESLYINVEGNQVILMPMIYSTYVEYAPFKFGPYNNTDVKNIQTWLLSNYSQGKNVWNEPFSTPEGMAKWQLEHFSDISVYTNKNMTSSSYGKNKLSITVFAPSGETSTTKVYCGSKGEPTSVSGASSWSYDNETKTATINVLHNGSIEVTVWFEHTPPTTTISLSGVPSDNKWFKSEVNVTLFATDDISGVDKTEYSFDNDTWTTYTTSFAISTEGHTDIYYKSTDKAGNVETTKNQTIKIDETPPTGSITINDNAPYTTTPVVTMTLSATDETSGIAEMRFSNDNTTWSEWDPYATSKSWILPPEDGVKGVAVQYKDNAGLISSYSDLIILDTRIPTANGGDDQTINEDTLATFDASASTDENGIATYIWAFTDVTRQTLSDKNPTYTFTTPGTYIVTLTVEDVAGNTAIDTVTIIVLLDTDEDGTPDLTDTDDDNDGMPDSWEIENRLDPLDPNDASLDPDGDGLTNLQEHQENTNPNISNAEAFPLWIKGIVAVVIGTVAVASVFWRRRKHRLKYDLNLQVRNSF